MISSWSHFHSRENCGVYWGGGCGLWLRCRVRVGCTTAACWDCWGWRREWWWHQSCSTETSEHTVCSSLHRYNIQHNIEWQTRCGSFHRYTDVSIQSPPAAPPSEPRDQHQHIQLDDRVQLQLESAPLCEQQHSVSVSHSVKGGNSRRTPCVLRFPGHTTNCTNTEQHVEGPGAAFTELQTAWCPVWTGGRNQVLSWNTRVCPQTGNTAGNFLTEVQLMDNTLPVSQNEAAAKHRKVFLSRWAQRRNTSVHRHQKLREVKHEVGVLVSIQKSCCETLSTHDRLWWHKHIMIQTERQTWSSWSSCMRTSWHERCVWECLPVTVTITQLLLTVIKLTWGQLCSLHMNHVTSHQCCGWL